MGVGTNWLRIGKRSKQTRADDTDLEEQSPRMKLRQTPLDLKDAQDRPPSADGENIRTNLSQYLTDQEKLNQAIDSLWTNREITVSYKLKKMKLK